ncbi:uncharacterized protein LOC110007460 [Amborella trichopoda]|uniref:Uncharacterized protein n=1 Tax=Amborella trichopoda TaxID=13333 RepID=W1PLW8_AMBTC|nr:uncharacterized protein LOC110007460 [Amborella trichopoda]ERN08150.1 hypothetical protein AMTR_s00018p00121660 [Amborella trichopoda]|eukprot:XP_020524239.1 uncharacterized protein LOC110007460 [Amborella trichopoda]
MFSNPTKTQKPNPSSEDTQKRLEREIRDIVSVLTHRLLDFPASSMDDPAAGIITLAGCNTGASLKADIDGLNANHFGLSSDGEEVMRACANSNFQAVNNSIMFGASCSAKNPGVHMVITTLDDSGHWSDDGSGKKEEKKMHKSKISSSRSDKEGAESA